ncbi:2557_t:CDS:2 [Scutellospora calospora]|uniref:2557_t:CDS:1 n=1 Tax=Scutellospora calospora TaxID=85575 RepID=A0ACA9K0X9_9GLOM|nr:2557_t:CDS:2 [Scutellospora calospora]
MTNSTLNQPSSEELNETSIKNNVISFSDQQDKKIQDDKELSSSIVGSEIIIHDKVTSSARNTTMGDIDTDFTDCLFTNILARFRVRV